MLKDACPYSCFVELELGEPKIGSARAGVAMLEDSELVCAELADDQILLHALRDYGFEIALRELQTRFPNARLQPPRVKYLLQPRHMEPYIKLQIQCPLAALTDVQEDLTMRRAIIEPSGNEKRGSLSALVPASELFGYEAMLRILTGATGDVVAVLFGGYRPF